jgi:hypothetical protein
VTAKVKLWVIKAWYIFQIFFTPKTELLRFSLVFYISFG